MESQNQPQNPYVISFLTIRKSIGFLGVLLPAVMWLGTLLNGECHQMQASVSDYYYTSMGDVFIGILVAIGLFLISYRGFDRTDNIATNIAGVLALCIAVFPTNKDIASLCTVRSLPVSDPRNMVHFGSAALFFLVLACISFFLFTKSDKKKEDLDRPKRRRNFVYRACGIVIVAAVACIAFFALTGIGNLRTFMHEHNLVFWLEWVALLAFGTSWLVKGEVILKDDPPVTV